MNYPGDEDARMPERWPQGGSGYRLTGTLRHRDPVRGFPPRSDARDPEYPPSHRQGWDVAPGGHEQDSRGARADVLTAARRESSAETDDEPDPAREAWNTDWGGGPWAAGLSGGGPWATGAADASNGHDSGALVGGVNGSQTWTYGEDDSTEIWTLRGHADSEPEIYGAEVDRVTPGKSGKKRTVPAWIATAAAAPVRRPEARRARTRRRGGRYRVLLVCAAVVAATALAAKAVYAFTGKHKTALAPSAVKPTPAQLAPPTPTQSAPTGAWKYITSRVDDPAPLRLTELFPAQASAGPVSYVRAAQLAGHSCRSAVFGSRLKAAVRQGCSQALRGSYMSVNGKRMGTIGVLNLATASAAAQVGKVVSEPGQFIQPLPAPYGVSRNLGKGTGVVWAVAKGHYLILMWAQYASLRSPAASGDRRVLMEFVNDLYQITANQSLTRRMVTGKPLPP